MKVVMIEKPMENLEIRREVERERFVYQIKKEEIYVGDLKTGKTFRENKKGRK